MFFEDAFDEFGKFVWGAAEAGNANFGEAFGDVFVEGRDATVGEREETDDADARFDHFFHAANQLGLVPAFDEIADEEKNGLGGIGDEFFAVGDGFVDVGAATELDAKDHVHRIVAALLGEIDDFSVERDDAGVQCR